MYSEFRLDVEFDKNRKITDVSSKYVLKITPPTDLAHSFYEYSQSFYKAAHSIASFLLETDKPNIAQLDSYFFALAFLYRHSIELILKALAFRNLTDKNDKAVFARDTFHDLAKILDELLIIESNPRPNEEITWLKNYFADASKMDKESDSFRYPFHIKRAPADLFSGPVFSIERIFEEQTHIDLVLFTNKFEAAFEILDLWYANKSEAATEWKVLKPIFIETGGYYYGQSVVGYGYRRQDFYPYVNAYTETTGYIRTQMKELYDAGDIGKSTDLFMPMCYLYRNATELVLKAAWFEEVREDFQQRCKILNKKKHSISGLWNQLRGWIKAFYGEEPNDTTYFDDITIVCDNLQGFDGTASKFRYPCTKEMDLHFNKQKTFDFMNVAEFMEGLIHAIDGIDSELGARNEYIDEIESEYRAEMESEFRASMSDYY